MSKHTPGPWSVVDGHYQSMREIQGPSFKINIVMSATDLNFQDYLSRSADARLIAAAPELLEALEAMLEIHGVTQSYAETHIEIPQSWVEVSDIARAAIAKALGEE